MAALGIKPAGGTNLKAAAKDAILWLLASRTSDGRIPYIIHPKDNSSVVFQPVGAPRGPLHGGHFMRAAPRGALHAGRSTGGSQIFFMLTCAQY